MNTPTLLGNWKTFWNMKVTIVLIVIGALGTVNKGLIQGLEDLEIIRRVETFKCLSKNKPLISPDFSLFLVWFGLVWFYDISIIVSYLMPNPFSYT